MRAFLRRKQQRPADPEGATDSPQIRGYVDSPAANAELLSAVPIMFSGWAMEGSEPAAGVDIVLDGQQKLRHGLRSPGSTSRLR